jgi:hypothetical protein
MSCGFRQQNMTRLRWDDFRHMDDMRITSYAGRYAINAPAINCPTTFFVNPTIRIQKNGDSWPTGQWKTDVESDLKGINRLGNRIRDGDLENLCPQAKGTVYNPATNQFNNTPLEDAPDGNFPMIFGRVDNPACTLRCTGWNRWDPLFHNPQETFETPFDYFIPSRDVDKEKCKNNRRMGPLKQ